MCVGMEGEREIERERAIMRKCVWEWRVKER